MSLVPAAALGAAGFLTSDQTHPFFLELVDV